MFLPGCSWGHGETTEGVSGQEEGVPETYALLKPAAVAESRTGGNEKRGRALYHTYCSNCHGTDGKGDGPAAAILSPRPRDHTNRAYMSTLTDEQLAEIIRKGGPALGRSPAMPPAKTLNEDDIIDLIAGVRALAE